MSKEQLNRVNRKIEILKELDKKNPYLEPKYKNEKFKELYQNKESN